MSGGARGVAALCFALALLALTGAGSANAAQKIGGCTIAPGAQCPDADLHGANLSGAKLSGANLAGANLGGTILHGADLRSANLVGANLERAELIKADLQGANLSGAYMQHTIGWGANVSHAGLTGAHMPQAVFHDANFYGSQLDGAYLARANFTHASLQHANFATSYLGLALFHHADARSANFHSATLHNTDFSGADLREAKFFNAGFHKTTMHLANAAGAKLWPSNLESDPVALNGLFEKVSAHLDGYDQYGGCDPGSTFASKERLPAEGGCSAKGQPGGSHGFNDTPNFKTIFFWEGGNKNTMTVKGLYGVALTGYCSHDWASFAVTSLSGLQAHPTQGIERPPGSPGGPLALDIRYRRWWTGPKAHEGYIMFMNGWLLRSPTQPVVPGPRPF